MRARPIRSLCSVIVLCGLCVLHVDAQVPDVSDERTPLLQQGMVVHRRVTMLADRVRRDLSVSRHASLTARATCLDDVLSNLHSTQRAIERWTREIEKEPEVSDRLRGMLVILRRHLKELRSEALDCFGGGGPGLGETILEVSISGPQPEEDPSVLPQTVVLDSIPPPRP